MQATGEEVPTQTKPEEEPEGQRVVLKEVTREDPDTNLGETVEVPVLDEPPGVEAAGGVIETGMAREPECSGVTTPRNINEGSRAAPVPMTALPLPLEEYQDMLELEDAKPETTQWKDP